MNGYIEHLLVLLRSLIKAFVEGDKDRLSKSFMAFKMSEDIKGLNLLEILKIILKVFILNFSCV